MTSGEVSGDLLKEMRQIRKLLVSSLIVSGVDATVIAKMLDYKDASGITHEKIPVARLKKTVPTVKILGPAQTKTPTRRRRRR
jgi:hypothetical protein